MCKGCQIPFDADKKVLDCLQEAGHETNQTLFDSQAYKRGKEFNISIVWHRNIDPSLFDFLATASSLKPKETHEEESNSLNNRPKEVRIEDCFKEFK